MPVGITRRLPLHTGPLSGSDPVANGTSEQIAAGNLKFYDDIAALLADIG